MRVVHYTNIVYSFDYAKATIKIDEVIQWNGDREFFVVASTPSNDRITLLYTENRDEAIAMIRLLDLYNSEYLENTVVQMPSKKLLNEFMENEAAFMEKYF